MEYTIVSSHVSGNNASKPFSSPYVKALPLMTDMTEDEKHLSSLREGKKPPSISFYGRRKGDSDHSQKYEIS